MRPRERGRRALAIPEQDERSLLFGRRDLVGQEPCKDLSLGLQTFAFLKTIAHGTRDEGRKAHTLVLRGGLGQTELAESHRDADLLRYGHVSDTSTGRSTLLPLCFTDDGDVVASVRAARDSAGACVPTGDLS